MLKIFTRFCILVSLCKAAAAAVQYGRRRTQQVCNEFDPPGVPVNFNDISGITWYMVRARPDVNRGDRKRITDATLEWFRNTKRAILRSRLVRNTGVCHYDILDFRRIPGTQLYEFDSTLWNLTTTNWRLIFRSQEYIVTWGCFTIDTNEGKCIDWGSGIFRRRPSLDIPQRDLRRIDRALRNTVCVGITGNFLIPPRNKPCPRLVFPFCSERF